MSGKPGIRLDLRKLQSEKFQHNALKSVHLLSIILLGHIQDFC